jgi:hypothetical protein
MRIYRLHAPGFYHIEGKYQKFSGVIRPYNLLLYRVSLLLCCRKAILICSHSIKKDIALEFIMVGTLVYLNTITNEVSNKSQEIILIFLFVSKWYTLCLILEGLYYWIVNVQSYFICGTAFVICKLLI